VDQGYIRVGGPDSQQVSGIKRKGVRERAANGNDGGTTVDRKVLRSAVYRAATGGQLSSKVLTRIMNRGQCK
jgi:hypothetical protein